MKIAIVSDTHDDIPSTLKALDIAKSKGCGMLLHAGDVCSPFTARLIRESEIPAQCVFGNNDGDRIHLAQRLDIKPAPRHIKIEGMDIIVFHEPLINDFINPERVDLLIYGHTHKLSVDESGSMTIINPGTVSGILVDFKSFVIFETEKRRIEVVEL